MLTFNNYQFEAHETADYPSGFVGDCNNAYTVNWLYPALGLSEEAGEVAGKFAKAVRDCNGKVDDTRREEIKKELGDVLLHVLFYAKIGEEKQHYDIVDVINFLCDKLIYRHPHVFSTAEVGGAEDVIKQWEMLKTKEKDGNKRVLSGVPDGLPPLLKAYRMQDKARGVGFDWECKEQVWDKVKEEMGEYQAELDAMAAARTEEEKAAAYDRAEDELGDFLFATVNAARLYGLNPDTALERTCAKFKRRFTYLEEQTIRQGRNLTDMTLAEMDAIWDEGKAKGL
mgnify:CR=1 FL=1